MAEAVLRVFRGDSENGETKDYKVPVEEGMVVLDALLYIQANYDGDLAVRWNCKAAKCGSCSTEINGMPKLSCKTRMDSLPQDQPITVYPMEFEQQWPRTIGRRLKKRRYVIAESGLVWEIDRFEELDLVLAEVELPTRDARAELPEWLAPHVVREVTDEPAYRNYELAMKSRSQESGVRSQESPES